MHKLRLATCLALSIALGFGLVGASQAGLFDWLRPHKKRPAATPKLSLVVFPFDQTDVNEADVPEGYGQELAAYLRTTLAGNPKYAVYLFSDRLAPIRRGKEVDNSLKAADSAPPFFEDDAKPLKLARVLAADFYVVGAIDAYGKYQPTTKTAQITLSAKLVNAKTGKLVGNYVVAGKADESSKASDEAEYRAVAAGKAVDALKSQILPDEAVDEKPAETVPAETPEAPAAPPAQPAPPPAEPAPAAEPQT